MIRCSFAGSDTTAIALRSILYNLMKSPIAYEKLQKEIDDADAKGELSKPIKYAEATKLQYLNAVCREGMRIHPSVAFPLPRNVPKGGATIAGRYFPEKVSAVYDTTMRATDVRNLAVSSWCECRRDTFQQDNLWGRC